jgi:hypothetical protein
MIVIRVYQIKGWMFLIIMRISRIFFLMFLVRINIKSPLESL